MKKWKIENSYESINIYRRYAINNTVKQVESSTRNSSTQLSRETDLLMNWPATLKSTRIYRIICTQSCFVSPHSYTIFLYTFALPWINLND